VRGTFSSIARRYDLANHCLSGGIDFLWRARAAKIVASWRPGRVLDLATGSGDLALAIRRACPGTPVVGADFCVPMLEIARDKSVPALVQADALALPFRDGVFGAVSVAFGLRNMASWPRAIAEIARVLEPGGRLLVMDFALPQNPILRGAYRIYLHRVLPVLAGLLTRRPDAYEYLAESIEKFPRWENMTCLLESGGLRPAAPVPLATGIAAIYTAQKPAGIFPHPVDGIFQNVGISSSGSRA